MFVYAVADALRKARVRFALAGGYAVALHGAVRGTVDVDIVLRLSRRDFIAAEAALRALGLVPRLPVSAAQVFDFREEYIEHKNLVAWSFANPGDPSQLVDIVITYDLARLRTKIIKSGGRALPVVAVADLIAMKKASGRAQDLEDIRALEELAK